MNIAAITNLNNYMKTQNMKRFVEMKKQNPGLNATLTPGGLFAAETKEASSPFGEQPDGKLAHITYRMNAGDDLSIEEMEYLRNKYPVLYEKAVKQKKERQEYERELRRCETKDEVRSLHMHKAAAALTQAKEAASNGDVATCMEINAKMNAMAKALAKFVVTQEYGNLAENHVELENAREAENVVAANENEDLILDAENQESDEVIFSDGNREVKNEIEGEGQNVPIESVDSSHKESVVREARPETVGGNGKGERKVDMPLEPAKPKKVAALYSQTQQAIGRKVSRKV